MRASSKALVERSIMRTNLLWIVIVFAATASRAQPLVLDGFETLDSWKVLPSDGVKASISVVDGAHGKALHLDYDFEAGAGFVVLRREVRLGSEMPANYRFTFKVKGRGPKNNLEFKLVDPSGDSVWWLNQRAYEWPTDWFDERIPARRIAFAWGPAGSSTPNPKPKEVAYVEFAIAAAEGGKGWVDLDSLTFEALPVPAPVTNAPEIKVVSPDTIDIDLHQAREFGGLILDWDQARFPVDYNILVSSDGERFEPAARVRSARGGLRFVPIRDGEGRTLRIVTINGSGEAPLLKSVEVPGVEFGSTSNAMFADIGKRIPAGWLPRHYRGEQTYWTVVGVPGDRDEALFNTDGAIEVATSGFSIEPFIWDSQRLITWADAKSSQTLTDDYLPIPTVTWDTGGLKLDITAFADGQTGNSTVVGRYTLTNTGSNSADGFLIVAIRPFQVLPPSQDLNITGGVSVIDSIACVDGRVSVNGVERVRAMTSPSGSGASVFAAGELPERWAGGAVPTDQAATDPMRLASGALHFKFDLAPGSSASFDVEALLRPGNQPWTSNTTPVTQRLADARRLWTELLNRVRLTLPKSAKRISDTFRTTQACILINQDGPAIQPGSRSYERSWMRDGSMTGAALLETGHPEVTKQFVEWFASFQYPNGKVPCVVDRRGPDPVPEHDSHGELIYAIWNCFEFTHDRDFLERMWPHIAKAVGYIDALRHERMTDEFRLGPPEKQAMFGLVPESISHEGYSAKPMHSYWDSFFIVKGLNDAVSAANELGKAQDAQRFAVILDEYQMALYASINLAMKNKGIDYIPGCVELGDFDATSTAIGVYPCGELARLPHAAVMRTFDKYFEFFEARRDGRLDWKDYTPYELRVASTFIRLGQPERAHALIEYFFKDQRPAAWNQWAEVVCRDPKSVRFLGDMPHTWVGSEFLHAARSMLVYEDGPTLVIGAGVKPEWPWEDDGVRVEAFPTEFGPLSYTLRGHGRRLTLNVEEGIRRGPGRCRFVIPGGRAIESITVNGERRAADGGGASGSPSVSWNGGAANVTVELKDR